jgi:hypothetical protein
MTTSIDTLRLDLPSQWVELPIAADEVETFLSGCSAAEGWKRLQPHERRQTENLVRRIVNELRAQRCQIAAIYTEVVSDNDDEDDGAGGEGTTSVLLASCVVSVVTREEVGTVLTLSPDILLAAMTTRSPNPTSYVQLEVPSLVSLPVGRAVRTLQLHAFNGSERSLFVNTFMVPIAPEYETMCVLQFTSPSLDMAGHFSDLFNAIAQTFAVYREGEPTPA